jgi:hypothetical protein
VGSRYTAAQTWAGGGHCRVCGGASHRAELQQDVALVADDLASRLLRLRGTYVRGDSLQCRNRATPCAGRGWTHIYIDERASCGRGVAKAVALIALHACC